MSCRCVDIARCQRDLDVLRGQAAPCARRANDSCTHIDTALSNAASSVGKAIETASIAELQSQLGKLGKQEHKAVWELDNGCVSEATRIAASISQMRTEDAAYHRSVAEAQAKAAAVARAQAQAQALAQAEAQAKAAMGKWQSR